MALTPTEEQEAILDAFDDEESFVVAAGAGTGKTSTLVMATDGQRDLKGLYVVFNKSAATEAERRFHDGVEVTTAHALAHRWMRRSTDENARLLEKLNAPWSYDHVVAGRIFSGSSKVTIEVATEGKPRKFGPLLMSRMALAAVKRYCQSGDVELGPEHVVRPETLSPAVWDSHAREALTEHVLPGARRALADAFDPRGDTVPFSHEMYLKCQPPGTMIKKIKRKGGSNRHSGESWNVETESVPIEDVRVGDLVMSYRDGTRDLRYNGRAVTHVGERHYEGEMVTVTTANGTSSSYTHDHICIAQMDWNGEKGMADKHVVYLMRKGDDYRVGRAKWAWSAGGRSPLKGLMYRMRYQQADAVWVLSVHDTVADAALKEALVQYEYRIPDAQFVSYGSLMNVADFWTIAGGNEKHARACLEDHGRDVLYPLWDRTSRLYKKTQEVRACNLMDGMQVYEVDTKTWSEGWSTITVERAPYAGTVHSIEVDVDHTYVADGIVTHNCWSLAKPDLSKRFDYLLFDEAQDANPAMAEVVLAQKGRMQIVVVGDQNQAINGFMGAQDAIGRFRRQHPDARVLPLTRSYRFGPEIASRANSVLGVLGSELVVEGGGGDGSVRLGGDRFDGVDAVLVRTNAGAIEEALAAVAADLVPYLHTDTKAMLKFLEGAEKLVGGRKSSHPSLEGFSTWREFEEFVRSNDSARREHGLSVSLVAEYGAANLVSLLSRVTGNTERGSDVTISTAHKVKGLEWEGVRLGDDFPDEFDATPDGESELMLAYVAATRARSLLLPGRLWPLTEHGVALSETALGAVRSLAAHDLRRDPSAHASEAEAFEAALSTRLDDLGRSAPAASVAAAVAAYLAAHPGPAAPYEAPGTRAASAPSSSAGGAGGGSAAEERPRRAPGPRDLVLPDGRTVMVWKRFSHHRLYVNSEEGVRLGFGDVKTGAITVESGERSEVVDAIEAHPDWSLVPA